TDVDLQVGAQLVAGAAARADASGATNDARALAQLARDLGRGALGGRIALALDAQLLQLMTRWPDRSLATRVAPLALDVDPELARFSTWYELFPRSTATEPGRHGTFRDVIARLPYVEAMGFD